MPAGVEPVVADASVDRLPTGWDAAVVYCPAVSEAAIAALDEQGRVLRVRTSAAADPQRAGEDFDPATLPADTLQLGWHLDADGDARWHTPAEVSAAALAVLDSGTSAVLGVVRPWGGHP